MADSRLMTVMVCGNLVHDIEKCDGCTYLKFEHQTTNDGRHGEHGLQYVPKNAIIPCVICSRYTGDEQYFIEKNGKTLLPCEVNMPCSNKPVGWRPRGEKA